MSITYDICAIMVTVVLLMSFMFRRNLFLKSGYYYVLYLVSLFVLIVTDIVIELDLLDVYSLSVSLKYIFRIINMMLIVFMTYNLLRYFLAVICYKKIKSSIKLLTIFVLSLTVLLLASTPLTGWVFKYEKDMLVRGPLYMLPYILGLICLCYIFVFQKWFKDLIQKTYMVIISISVGLLIFAGIWHLFFADYYGVRIFGYVYMLIAMFLYMSLQEPYEYYYKYNLCFNEKAFLDNTENRLVDEKKFSILFLGFDNMNTVFDALPAQQKEEMERHLIRDLVAVCKKKNVFIVDPLSFAIIVEQDPREMTIRVLNIAEKIQAEADINIRSFKPFVYVFRNGNFSHPDHVYKALSYFKERKDREIEKYSTIENLNLSKFDYFDREMKIFSALLTAIRTENFSVYFQPIFDSNNSNFASAEALLRLYDPELGVIYPTEFIPIAEKNGLMVLIGEMVFERVCDIASRYNLRSLGMDFIEVNLSTMQCLQPDLADRLIDITQKYHLSPKFINLEIKDTACVNDENGIMLKNVKKLNEFGMTFTIDNFGTAVANAEKILKFPVKYVKFDKSVIWNSLLNEKCKIVTGNMVRMIQDLNLECVACGIETENLFSVVSGMKFSYFQGYYFAKPIPEEEFVNFLTSRLS